MRLHKRGALFLSVAVLLCGMSVAACCGASDDASGDWAARTLQALQIDLGNQAITDKTRSDLLMIGLGAYYNARTTGTLNSTVSLDCPFMTALKKAFPDFNEDRFEGDLKGKGRLTVAAIGGFCDKKTNAIRAARPSAGAESTIPAPSFRNVQLYAWVSFDPASGQLAKLLRSSPVAVSQLKGLDFSARLHTPVRSDVELCPDGHGGYEMIVLASKELIQEIDGLNHGHETFAVALATDEDVLASASLRTLPTPSADGMPLTIRVIGKEQADRIAQSLKKALNPK